jgi:hypothetical protein
MEHAENIEAGLHSLTGRATENERAWRGSVLEAAKPGSLEHGLALHAFGDSYTHSYQPENGGVTDVPGPSDLQVQFEVPLGHGAFGTRPDEILERPKLYGRYVTDLFKILSKRHPPARSWIRRPLDALAAAVSAKATESEQIDALREFAKASSGSISGTSGRSCDKRKRGISPVSLRASDRGHRPR